MNLSDIKLGKKLGAAFAFVVLLNVVVGGFAVKELSRLHSNTEDIATNWMVGVRSLADIRDALAEFRRAEALMLMLDSPQERAGEEARMAKARKQVEELMAVYEPTAETPAEQQLVARFKQQLSAYYAANEKLLSFVREGETGLSEARKAYKTNSREAFRAARAILNEDIDYNNKGADGATRTLSPPTRGLAPW